MEATHAMPLWQAIFAGLIGLLYIIAGYRTMRFTTRIASALLFMTAAYLFAPQVQHWAAAAGIILGAGILGFLLGNALYFLIVALYGAGGGVALAAIVVGAFGGKVGLGSGIAGALTGLVLAFVIERPVGIFATSVMGGWGIAQAIASALASTGAVSDQHEHYRRFGLGYLALTLGLTVLGCVVQAKTTKNLPPREEAGGKDPAQAR